MKILTPENRAYELDHVPDIVDDLRFCVLDCSDKKNIDYFFLPLIFLESFYAPAVVLEIGKHKIQMPMDWSIVVCDQDYSDLEIIPLTSLNDRGFHCLPYNPLNHMVPVPEEISIVNVYTEVKWYFPKLKNGNVLVVPIEDGNTPLCLLFIKETTKTLESIDISELF